MATRINYGHRQRICDAAENAAFSDELAELATKRAELDRLLATHVLEQYRKLHKVKEEFTTPYNNFSVALYPETRPVAVQTYYVSINLTEPVMGPLPTRELDARNRITAESDDLYAKYKALSERENSIMRVRSTIRQKVYDLTTKASTLEALAKLWPEGVQFITHANGFELDKKAELETLRKDVNELILQSGVELQD
jgi:hypothetical protein